MILKMEFEEEPCRMRDGDSEEQTGWCSLLKWNTVSWIDALGKVNSVSGF